MWWRRPIFMCLLALWASTFVVSIVGHLWIFPICSVRLRLAGLLGVGVVFLGVIFSALFRRRGPMKTGLLFLGAAGALFCTLFGLLPSETVFTFDPAIDTQTSPGFSRKAFLEIEPGMNEAQVLELVGEPMGRRVWETPGPRRDFDQSWGYSRDGGCGWCDAAWRSYTVYFRAGVVLRAAEQWHCD